MKRVLILYLPVVHQGVLDLVLRQKPNRIFVLGEEILQNLGFTTRDARALSPVRNSLILRTLIALEKGFETTKVQVLTKEVGVRDVREIDEVVMPYEDTTISFADKYFSEREIIWDTGFVRWNMTNVTKEFLVDPDEEICKTDFARKMISLAKKEATKSPDWWRQVGAVLIKSDKVTIVTYNRHYPGDYTVYFDGDPRAIFNAGERIDLSLGEHAEARIIALCARSGVSTKGSKMFVTTFPCPTCAKLIITAGVKELYYLSGYSLLNAREIFKHFGVKVFRVVM